MSTDPISTIRESLSFSEDAIRNYDYRSVFHGDYQKAEALRKERLADVAAAREWLRGVVE